MPVIGVENWPIQFEVPAPSVAVPNTANETFVPVAVSVKRIGEPPNTEQERPIPELGQTVLADPGPAPVIVNRSDGCAANWMNGLFAARPAPRTIGFPFADSTPSAETTQPAAASTPEGQRANIKAVVFVTSAFQGGPGGIDVVSVLYEMLLRLTVVLPLPDDVFNSPTMVAEAAVTKHKRTSVARATVRTLELLICCLPPPILSCLRRRP